MTKYLKYFVAGAALFGGAIFAIGATTSNQPTQQAYSYQQFTFFSATTTTATSTNTAVGDFFIIKGAKKVDMYFTHGGTATTSTTGQYFKVQTTRDGLTWNDFNKLIGADVSSTATSTYIMTGATSTIPVALDLSDDTFYGIRCISTEIAGALATDGEATCKAAAEF